MTIYVLTSNGATYGSGSFWVYNNVWRPIDLVNEINFTQSISVDERSRWRHDPGRHAQDSGSKASNGSEGKP